MYVLFHKSGGRDFAAKLIGGNYVSCRGKSITTWLYWLYTSLRINPLCSTTTTTTLPISAVHPCVLLQVNMLEMNGRASCDGQRLFSLAPSLKGLFSFYVGVFICVFLKSHTPLLLPCPRTDKFDYSI